MDQSEKGVSAYLDYFAANPRDGVEANGSMETASCSTNDSTDISDPEYDDDDYDPSEDIDAVENGDTTSSDDWEWVPCKRKKRKQTPKRPHESFSGEPLSNGFSSGKGRLTGSDKRVGYVNNPNTFGEPSKTILRNILESPPAASLNCLPSQKSKSTLFSPCLQALLMKMPDAASVSSKCDVQSKTGSIPSLNGSIPSLNGSKQIHSFDCVLPGSSILVDGARNIVPGSASSLLVAVLKKAIPSTSKTQGRVSDPNIQLAANNKQKTMNHIKNAFDINKPDVVPQNKPNSVPVFCDICKTKSTTTVSLRLAVPENDAANIKQWKLCERCEFKLVGSATESNHGALQFKNADLLSSSSDFWNKFQHGFKPTDTYLKSEQLCNIELPSESVVVKIEPPDFIGEQDVSVSICEQMSSKELHSKGISLMESPFDIVESNVSFKSPEGEKIHSAEFNPDKYDTMKSFCGEYDTVVSSEQTRDEESFSGRINTEPTDDIDHNINSSKQLPGSEKCVLTESADEHSASALSSEQINNKEFICRRIKMEPFDDIIDHKTSFSVFNQIPNKEYLSDKSVMMEPFDEYNTSVISSEPARKKECLSGRIKIEPSDDSIDHITFDSYQQIPNHKFLSNDTHYNISKCRSYLNSERLSNDFLSTRIRVDPNDSSDKHNSPVEYSVQMNNEDSELTEQDCLPQCVVVKQEPVDDYQRETSVNTACGIKDDATLQGFPTRGNTLNKSVNSSTGQYTSILAQLLNPQNKITPIHIGFSQSKIHSQVPASHSDISVRKTCDGKLSVASSSLLCCEKEHIAQSPNKDSVSQNMLLSLLRRPEQEQAGSTNCSSISSSIPVMDDFARTAFADLNVKKEPVDVLESSNGAEAPVQFSQSLSYLVLPTHSDNPQTTTSIFHSNCDISHTDLNIPQTDPNTPSSNSSICHTDSCISHLDAGVFQINSNTAQTDSSVPEGHGRSDLWASNGFEQNASVPKSSSLLLQELCKSHLTKTKSGDDTSLSQSPCDKASAFPCSNHLRNPSLVQALTAPATYNLSILLRQLSQRSSKMNDPSNSGSLILQKMDKCQSGLNLDSSVISLDIATIPCSTNINESAQVLKNILNGADSVVSAMNPNITADSVSPVEKAVDGIQPRNAFQNETGADNISKRTRAKDYQQTGDILLQKVSEKSKHKSGKDSGVGAKVIDKEDLNKLKPFVCMRCSQSFATSDNLMVHVRSHEQDKVFGCGICGRKYSTNSILKRHINKYHLPIGQRSKNKKAK